MESRFSIGKEVVINFGKSGLISGVICGVAFTESKVYYDITINPFSDNQYNQTVSRIDSYFVELPEDRFNGNSNIGLVESEN